MIAPTIGVLSRLLPYPHDQRVRKVWRLCYSGETRPITGSKGETQPIRPMDKRALQKGCVRNLEKLNNLLIVTGLLALEGVTQPQGVQCKPIRLVRFFTKEKRIYFTQLFGL